MALAGSNDGFHITKRLVTYAHQIVAVKLYLLLHIYIHIYIHVHGSAVIFIQWWGGGEGEGEGGNDTWLYKLEIACFSK